MDFVEFDTSEMTIKAMRTIGVAVDRKFFNVRCNNQAIFWQLVRNGCGVRATQTSINDAEMKRLTSLSKLPSLPV